MINQNCEFEINSRNLIFKDNKNELLSSLCKNRSAIQIFNKLLFKLTVIDRF